MSYLAMILIILSSSLLIIAAVAFLKAKDVFMMVQIVKISNLYITPLLLIAIWLDNFSWISLAKIVALILLNIIATNLICYSIARKATADKITPDSK
jgi:multisubunit Na+/H+ antiporter MnhG subunit